MMLYVHLQNPDTCSMDTKYSMGKEDTLLGFVCVCVSRYSSNIVQVYTDKKNQSLHVQF